MLEIIILGILIYIYITPIKGFVNLSETLLEIKEKLCDFSLDISEDDLVNEDGTSSLIDTDFSTMVDLNNENDLNIKSDMTNNTSKESYKDFKDIDISKL